MKYVSDNMQIGKAGEYLVCADLILKGFVAYPSEQGLPYDVVLDTGEKLLKIQVKTTKEPREITQRKNNTYCYVFELSRHGVLNKERYKENEVDIFALVALDTKQIGYVTKGEFRSTMNFRSDSLRGTYYDEKGVADYEKVIEMSKHISNQSEISRRLNMQIATVNRMLQPNYKPFVTNARYFSDIVRERDWFDKL